MHSYMVSVTLVQCCSYDNSCSFSGWQFSSLHYTNNFLPNAQITYLLKRLLFHPRPAHVATHAHKHKIMLTTRALFRHLQWHHHEKPTQTVLSILPEVLQLSFLFEC